MSYCFYFKNREAYAPVNNDILLAELPLIIMFSYKKECVGRYEEKVYKNILVNKIGRKCFTNPSAWTFVCLVTYVDFGWCLH